jgi:anti-sigma-K factor RskA
MSNKKQDELDSILDTALAKYAAAEPRTGLEDRVLANLRAERTRIPVHAGWRWSVAAVLAVVIVAVALVLRSGESSHPVVADHSTAQMQGTKEPAKQIAFDGERGAIRSLEPAPARNKTGHHSRPPVEIAIPPKL